MSALHDSNRLGFLVFSFCCSALLTTGDDFSLRSTVTAAENNPRDVFEACAQDPDLDDATKAAWEDDSVCLLQPHMEVVSERWLSSADADMGMGGLVEKNSYDILAANASAVAPFAEEPSTQPHLKSEPMPRMFEAVIILVAVHFALDVLSRYVIWYGQVFSKDGACFSQDVQNSAKSPVDHYAMLATLFTIPWFKSLRISGHLDPTQLGLPNDWIQLLIFVCALVLSLQAIIHYVGSISIVAFAEHRAVGKLELEKRLRYMGTVACGANLLMVITVICVVINTILIAELPDEFKKPDAHGAIHRRWCTTTFDVLLLAIIYFMLHVIQEFWTLTNKEQENSPEVGLTNALDSAVLVPMLSLQMKATAMHAMEQRPPAGQPPETVRVVMDVSSYSLFATILLQLVLSLSPTARAAFEVNTGRRGLLLNTFRNVLHLLVFVTALWISVSLWTDPALVRIKRYTTGKSHPFDVFDDRTFVSDMVLCTVLISTVFFGLRFLCWVIDKLEPSPRTQRITKSVLQALKVCPIVAVLFVFLRLRSLQLGAGRGEPAEIVEGFMYIAIFATCGRVICAAMLAAFPQVGDDEVVDGDDPMIGPDASPRLAPLVASASSRKLADADTTDEEAPCAASHNTICSKTSGIVINVVLIIIQHVLWLSIAFMLYGCCSMDKDNMQKLKRPFGQYIDRK